MIERVRIADIMTPADEVIFYDPAMEDECVKFCKNRNIEYLPSLEDPNNKAYCRSEKGFFEEITLDDSLKIDVNLDAFSEQALSKFKQNKVLFVYNYGEFCGIIHFSDYNNDKIKVYIYSIILLYETSLRKILRINNIKDLRGMDFEKHRIGELIDEISKNDKIKMRITNKDILRNFRNSIMHFHTTIKNKGINLDKFIYEENDFIVFTKNVNILMYEIRRVKTYILTK
ncbi:MAG: hypothetical protein LCH85_24535 [Chloroflexi bacterium]|nr:hypothetical protein [Chloroflexota bacterium]